MVSGKESSKSVLHETPPLLFLRFASLLSFTANQNPYQTNLWSMGKKTLLVLETNTNSKE